MKATHILLRSLSFLALAFVFVVSSTTHENIAKATPVKNTHNSYQVHLDDTYMLSPDRKETPVFNANGVLQFAAECANDDTAFGLIVQVKEAQDGMNTVVAEPIHVNCSGGMRPTAFTANVQGPVFVDAYSIVDFRVIVSN